MIAFPAVDAPLTALPLSDRCLPMKEPTRWSRAARRLAEHGPALEAGIQQIHEQAAELAGRFGAAQLHKMVAATGPQRRPIAPEDLQAVTLAYAQASAEASGAPAKLAELTRAAARERGLAAELNRLLLASEDADRSIRSLVRGRDGHEMAAALLARLDEVLVAQCAGGHAGRVAAACQEEDADIAAAALAELPVAARWLAGLAEAPPETDAGPVLALSARVRARGARVFCRAVLGALELRSLPVEPYEL
ncbi:hypothetical protein [Planomonospora sp. ID82291]|uniref:hypothetical protein n=1 Tax=Planomonospora sp. ID82291 TaxID=2738136 RepID=UPI0018C37026|nr:hypothetical protein [Planomonospora sp. ID82291]MBG0818292.1 hypothetical protein [Planomonospora sp. ID82291]